MTHNLDMERAAELAEAARKANEAISCASFDEIGEIILADARQRPLRMVMLELSCVAALAQMTPLCPRCEQSLFEQVEATRAEIMKEWECLTT